MQFFYKLTYLQTKRRFKNVLWRVSNLTEEDKKRKGEYGRERYKNLSEDKKERLVEHRKRYYEMQKKKIITARSLNTISAFSYKSKNVTILRQPRFQLLAIRVDENAAILGHPDVFEIKYIEFLY